MGAVELKERRILFLLGVIQFVNFLDFMMVMPLGPDFAKGLSIAYSDLGLIGGAYMLAAAISSVASSRFLDRFDRRNALLVMLMGLALGTALGGMAQGLVSLLFARIVAGMFGGPAASLCLAIIADVVQPARRGHAVGVVMSGVAAASVLGVPASLWVADVGGWQAPFAVVSLLGVAATLAAFLLLPRLRVHLLCGTGEVGGPFLRKPSVAASLVATFAAMAGNFAIIPNLSAFLQFNHGYPREDLDLLYFVGGLVTLVSMSIAGALADRLGTSSSVFAGTLMYLGTLVAGFMFPVAILPISAAFVAFMATGTFRLVPMQALGTRVPAAHERARFMATQSAVQHVASASGAMLGASLLHTNENGSLSGFEQVIWFGGAMACLLPLLVVFVEREVRRRDAQLAPAAPTIETSQPEPRAPGEPLREVSG